MNKLIDQYKEGIEKETRLRDSHPEGSKKWEFHNNKIREMRSFLKMFTKNNLLAHGQV